MAEGPDAERVILDLTQQAAQDRGKLAVAYHSDMRKSAPDAQLAAVTHQWGDYYTRRAKAVLDGTWKSERCEVA